MMQRNRQLDHPSERGAAATPERTPLALEAFVRLEEQPFAKETRGRAKRDSERRRAVDFRAAKRRRRREPGAQALPGRIVARRSGEPAPERVEPGVVRERREDHRSDVMPPDTIAVDLERRHGTKSCAISSACRSASARPSA